MNNLAFGVVAAIAFLIGALTIDRFYAYRFGWLKVKARTPFAPVTIDAFDWATLATGTSGWVEIEKAWLRKAQELYEIFCSKQSDYGPTNIGVGGEQGITIRLGDKISRLFELLGLTSRENTGKPANEAIRDTWADIGDYGIIGMMVHDGDWPLVEPNTVWGKEAMVDLMFDMIGDDEELLSDLLVRLATFGLAKQIADDLGAEVKSG